MQDRIPTQPGRMEITHADGTGGVCDHGTGRPADAGRDADKQEHAAKGRYGGAHRLTNYRRAR